MTKGHRAILASVQHTQRTLPSVSKKVFGDTSDVSKGKASAGLSVLRSRRFVKAVPPEDTESGEQEFTITGRGRKVLDAG